MAIQPLGDRVLIEPIEEKVQEIGGIIIPDSAKEKPQESKVVAVGPGKRNDRGELISVEVKVGDIVLTSKYGGTEVKYAGKTLKLVSAGDILAIVTE